MKDLNQLFNKYGLDTLSHGCSTGSEWFSSGEKIESYSPVNGKLIGEISSGSKMILITLFKFLKKHLKNFEKFLLQKEVNSFVSLEIN
jgi:hypothetical protein